MVIWALVDEGGTTLINWDINTGKSRFDVADITLSGSSSEPGRRAIINTVKRAKITREL